MTCAEKKKIERVSFAVQAVVRSSFHNLKKALFSFALKDLTMTDLLTPCQWNSLSIMIFNIFYAKKGNNTAHDHPVHFFFIYCKLMHTYYVLRVDKIR